PKAHQVLSFRSRHEGRDGKPGLACKSNWIESAAFADYTGAATPGAPETEFFHSSESLAAPAPPRPKRGCKSGAGTCHDWGSYGAWGRRGASKSGKPFGITAVDTGSVARYIRRPAVD